MSRLRTHLTYANVVSTLCLFILLGGAAYGAAKTVLPKHSVGTAQLKNGAVTTKQIKANAVNGAKVADGTLTGADVADGSLTGTDVADGSLTGTDVADGSLTGSDVAAGSLGTAALADGSVNSAKVLDKSLTGGDVAPDSLTGTQIDESTLGTVPSATNADKLGGKASTEFISSAIYKAESAVEAGTTIGDGTQVAAEACNTGDILLAGGPANIAATTTLLESFPSPGSTNSWSVRVNKNGQTDNFNVVVLCAKQ